MIPKANTLEMIHMRPGMYLGATDEMGLAHLVFWAVDDVVGNFRAGHGQRVSVQILEGDGAPSCVISDEGPFVGAAEGTLDEQLEHLTSEFGDGLPARGTVPELPLRSYLPVVRAVSSRMQVLAAHSGRIHRLDCRYLESAHSVDQTDAALRPWTFVTQFWPDPEIFGDSRFDCAVLRRRLQEVAACCPGFVAKICAGGGEPWQELSMPNGMADIVTRLHGSEAPVGGVPFRLQASLPADGLAFDVAIRWGWNKRNFIESWANTVRTREGSHVLGLTEALRATGLDQTPHTAAISVSVPQPRFSSPTKDRLMAPEIRAFVRDQLTAALRRQLDDDQWALEHEHIRERLAEKSRGGAVPDEE